MIAEVDVDSVPLIFTFDDLTAESVAEQMASLIMARVMMMNYMTEGDDF